MSQILKSTLEGFRKLDLNQLPGPLKTIVAQLTEILYIERDNSPFIDQCVQTVRQDIQKGTLKNFLKDKELPQELKIPRSLYLGYKAPKVLS